MYIPTINTHYTHAPVHEQLDIVCIRHTQITTLFISQRRKKTTNLKQLNIDKERNINI